MSYTKHVSSLAEYEDAACRTLSKIDPTVLALGIAGEAGEVADLTKKWIGHGHDYVQDKFVKELGDVLWYVACLARAHGSSLEEVANTNVEKLRARYPDGFSSERSKNRVDP